MLAWPGPPVRATSMPAWRASSVEQVGRLAALDVLAREHGDRGEGLVGRHRRAVGGDHDRAEFGIAGAAARGRREGCGQRPRRQRGKACCASTCGFSVTHTRVEHVAECLRQETGADATRRSCRVALRNVPMTAQPMAARHGPGPVSGLASDPRCLRIGPSPSQARAQWRDEGLRWLTVAGAVPDSHRLPVTRGGECSAASRAPHPGRVEPRTRRRRRRAGAARSAGSRPGSPRCSRRCRRRRRPAPRSARRRRGNAARTLVDHSRKREITSLVKRRPSSVGVTRSAPTSSQPRSRARSQPLPRSPRAAGRCAPRNRRARSPRPGATR